MKSYHLEASAFGGGETFTICICGNEKIAILIAQNLDRHGEFKGKSLLGNEAEWTIRVIEEDEESGNIEVIWEGKQATQPRKYN